VKFTGEGDNCSSLAFPFWDLDFFRDGGERGLLDWVGTLDPLAGRGIALLVGLGPVDARVGRVEVSSASSSCSDLVSESDSCSGSESGGESECNGCEFNFFTKCFSLTSRRISKGLISSFTKVSCVIDIGKNKAYNGRGSSSRHHGLEVIGAFEQSAQGLCTSQACHQ